MLLSLAHLSVHIWVCVHGRYDVVCNLGALAARFVFKPVEENFYVFFAKVIKRDGDGDANTKENISLAAKTLATLLWFVALIGLTVLCYGQAYSRALLHLYGGTTLSDGPGPTLLRTYCVYVLMLAVNGITECFFFATAPTAYLSYFNRVMVSSSLRSSNVHSEMCFLQLLHSPLLLQVGLSVAFLAACWYFTVFLDLGAQGFIFANCVNMGTSCEQNYV